MTSKAPEGQRTIAHGVSHGIEYDPTIKPWRGDISQESPVTRAYVFHVAPQGLNVPWTVPTADAVGYRMPPLRG